MLLVTRVYRNKNIIYNVLLSLEFFVGIAEKSFIRYIQFQESQDLGEVKLELF